MDDSFRSVSHQSYLTAKRRKLHVPYQIVEKEGRIKDAFFAFTRVFRRHLPHTIQNERKKCLNYATDTKALVVITICKFEQADIGQCYVVSRSTNFIQLRIKKNEKKRRTTRRAKEGGICSNLACRGQVIAVKNRFQV